jgi:hypothetical protein
MNYEKYKLVNDVIDGMIYVDDLEKWVSINSLEEANQIIKFYESTK